MKRIYFALLVVMAACIISIAGCRKNQEPMPATGGTVLTAEELAKDESFISLNNVISRFDPQYLVLVYKDKRTIEEITQQSHELLKQLNTNPESILYQKQLADFYHLASIDQLKQYSASITGSLKKLDEKYNFQKTLFAGNGGGLYYRARILFAKNKLNTLQTDDKRIKKNGLWLDLVESELSSFDYYNSVVYDEGLEEAGEGGGSDPCNGETCCYTQSLCLLEAKNNFYKNLVSYAAKGAVTLGTAAGAGLGTVGGATGGPVSGFLAGLAGVFIGGAAGGSAGAILANSIYRTDQDICKIKYQTCISNKTSK